MAVIVLYKIILTLVILTVLYFRPVFAFTLVILFYWEHVLFLINALNLFKNSKNYFCIKVDYVDISSLSASGIWYECCKHRAFKRLYRLLSKKKKLKMIDIVFVLFIIILGMPVNFIYLVYYFIKSKENFHDSLEILYFKEYYMIKNWKIEIYNDKIYLNCYTVGKFLKNFKTINVDDKVCVSLFKDLQDLLKNDLSSNNTFIPLKLTQGFDKNNKCIFNSHYAFTVDKNSIHATSNVPKNITYGSKKLTDFGGFAQWVEPPMKSAIKTDSKSPGTIVTTGVNNFKQASNKIWVLEKEIKTIQFLNYEHFNINKSSYSEIETKNKNIEKILQAHLGQLYYVLNPRLQNDLLIGNYDFIFDQFKSWEILAFYKDDSNF